MDEKRGGKRKVLIVMIITILLSVIMSFNVVSEGGCPDYPDGPFYFDKGGACCSGTNKCLSRDCCIACVPKDEAAGWCDGCEDKCVYDKIWNWPGFDPECEVPGNPWLFTNDECCFAYNKRACTGQRAPNNLDPAYLDFYYMERCWCCDATSTPCQISVNYFDYSLLIGKELVGVMPINWTSTCCEEPNSICEIDYNEYEFGCYGAEAQDVFINRTCYECYGDPLNAAHLGVDFSQTCWDNGERSCCYDECYNRTEADCCSYSGWSGTFPNMYDWGFCGDNSWLCDGSLPSCGYVFEWKDNSTGGQWDCNKTKITVYTNTDPVEEKKCYECSGGPGFQDIDKCALLNPGFGAPSCCYGKCYDGDVEHCCNDGTTDTTGWCEGEKLCEGNKSGSPGDLGYGECCDIDGNGGHDTCCGEGKLFSTPFCVEITKWNDGADPGEWCELEPGLKEGEAQHRCVECRNDDDCIEKHGEDYRCCKLVGGENKCYNATEKSCCGSGTKGTPEEDIRCSEKVYVPSTSSFYSPHLFPSSSCMFSISAEDCCGDPCEKCSEGCGIGAGCGMCEPTNSDPLVLYADVLSNYDFTYDNKTLGELKYPSPYLRTCWFDLEAFTPKQVAAFEEMIKDNELKVAPPNGSMCGDTFCPFEFVIDLLKKALNADDVNIGIISGFPGITIEFSYNVKEKNTTSTFPIEIEEIFVGASLYRELVEEDTKEKGWSDSKPKPEPPPHKPIPPKPTLPPPKQGLSSGTFNILVSGGCLSSATSPVVGGVCASDPDATDQGGTKKVSKLGTALSIGFKYRIKWGLVKKVPFLHMVVFNPTSGAVSMLMGFEVKVFGIKTRVYVFDLLTGTWTPYWAAISLASPLIEKGLEYMGSVIEDIPIIGPSCVKAGESVITLVKVVDEAVRCTLGGLAKVLCDIISCAIPSPGPPAP